MLGPLDAITIKCERLRAHMNTKSKNHEAAMDIHAHILHQVTANSENQTLSRDEATTLGIEELRRLKQVYRKCGGWGQRRRETFVQLSRSFVEVVGGLDEDFGEFADIPSWSKESNRADDLDAENGWVVPEDFVIDKDEGEIEHSAGVDHESPSADV